MRAQLGQLPLQPAAMLRVFATVESGLALERFVLALQLRHLPFQRLVFRPKVGPLLHVMIVALKPRACGPTLRQAQSASRA